MRFLNTLAEDLSRIIEIAADSSITDEVNPLASVVNPLSIASALDSVEMTTEDICDDFQEIFAEIGFKVDYTEEMITRWAVDCITRLASRSVWARPEINVVNDDIPLYVEDANTYTFSSLFGAVGKAIQIVAVPATAGGKTMAITVSRDEGPLGLVNAIRDQFGEFIMVIYPLDLSIGNLRKTGLRTNVDFIFQLYNDMTNSATTGFITQGDICEKCGDFFSIFPEQLEFCCKI